MGVRLLICVTYEMKNHPEFVFLTTLLGSIKVYNLTLVTSNGKSLDRIEFGSVKIIKIAHIFTLVPRVQ